MITIRNCTSSDAALVASLWNAKTLEPDSCWYQSGNVDAAYVGNVLSAGYTFALVSSDSTPVGFGLWCQEGELARLIALAAPTDATYYRLMQTFCEWGQQRMLASGFAEIDSRLTAERARMDALAVIAYTPIGFEPLAPGEDPAQRVPRLFRAACGLATLAERLAEVLEESP